MKVKYSELKVNDVIMWYGAKVRITKINRIKRVLNAKTQKEENCTYFTIEPFDDNAVKILGSFYARGTYGGVDWLEVHKVG